MPSNTNRRRRWRGLARARAWRGGRAWTPRDTKPSAGFTLLEVLIAFLIAALALGVLFRGAVEGQATSRTAFRYEEALSRARSHLAAMDAAGPPRAGDQQGDDGGGFRWRLRITPLQAAAPGVNGLAPMMFAVRVAISWEADGRERTVQLDTRRLGVAPPRPP